MKTGAEIVDFKGYNALNKQNIAGFEKLKARKVTDVVNTSSELFDAEEEPVEEIPQEVIVDEIDSDTPQDDESFEDELEIDGGIKLKKYHSHPYGIGVEPNTYRDNGVSKIKRFIDFTRVKR